MNMPLARIDVDASTAPETRSTICDVVYDAMTSMANVPAHDKFMVVTKHGAEDLVFPKKVI
jgi:4-oxalocrotonate tautomerase